MINEREARREDPWQCGSRSKGAAAEPTGGEAQRERPVESEAAAEPQRGRPREGSGHQVALREHAAVTAPPSRCARVGDESADLSVVGGAPAAA